MSDINIHVEFFGAFRKFGEGLDFSVPEGSTISKVKAALKDKLDGYELVSDSVLASNSDVLRNSDVLNNDVELSILPPVCGG